MTEHADPAHIDPAMAARAADLRRWRAQFTDAVPIDEAPLRQSTVCVGVVRALRLVPGRQLEVTVEDGHGRMTAVFSGRNRLPGLEMGSGLRLEGTLREEGSRREMRNPEWSLVAEPYA